MARVLLIVGGGLLRKAGSLNLQWDESKRRRGQPGNAGQFASTGGGASAAGNGGDGNNGDGDGNGNGNAPKDLAAVLGRTQSFEQQEREPTRLKFGVEDLVLSDAERKQSPWTWRIKRIAETIGDIMEPMALWALTDEMVEHLRREVIDNDDQVGQMMVDIHRNMRASFSKREIEETRATVVAMFRAAVEQQYEERKAGGAPDVRKAVPGDADGPRTLEEAFLPPRAPARGAQRLVVGFFRGLAGLCKGAGQLTLFDESKVQRHPKGSGKGGQFAPKSGAATSDGAAETTGAPDPKTAPLASDEFGGVASSAAVTDRQGDRITTEALEATAETLPGKPLKAYGGHNRGDTIGYIRSAWVEDGKLYVRGVIDPDPNVPTLELSMGAWSMSLGGRVPGTEWRKDEEAGHSIRYLTELDVDHVLACAPREAANPGAWVVFGPTEEGLDAVEEEAVADVQRAAAGVRKSLAGRILAVFGLRKSQLSLFDESNVARQPKGSDKGGQFAPKGGGQQSLFGAAATEPQKPKKQAGPKRRRNDGDLESALAAASHNAQVDNEDKYVYGVYRGSFGGLMGVFNEPPAVGTSYYHATPDGEVERVEYEHDNTAHGITDPDEARAHILEALAAAPEGVDAYDLSRPVHQATWEGVYEDMLRDGAIVYDEEADVVLAAPAADAEPDLPEHVAPYARELEEKYVALRRKYNELAEGLTWDKEAGRLSGEGADEAEELSAEISRMEGDLHRKLGSEGLRRLQDEASASRGVEESSAVGADQAPQRDPEVVERKRVKATRRQQERDKANARKVAALEEQLRAEAEQAPPLTETDVADGQALFNAAGGVDLVRAGREGITVQVGGKPGRVWVSQGRGRSRDTSYINLEVKRVPTIERPDGTMTQMARVAKERYRAKLSTPEGPARDQFALAKSTVVAVVRRRTEEARA